VLFVRVDMHVNVDVYERMRLRAVRGRDRSSVMWMRSKD
jgi:hypothetical protein